VLQMTKVKTKLHVECLGVKLEISRQRLQLKKLGKTIWENCSIKRIYALVLNMKI